MGIFLNELKGNKAIREGGDIYVLESSSIQMNECSFRDSYAQHGSMLYGEAIADEVLSLQNIQVSNIMSDLADAVVIYINLGVFLMSNSQFRDITSALFKF